MLQIEVIQHKTIKTPSRILIQNSMLRMINKDNKKARVEAAIEDKIQEEVVEAVEEIEEGLEIVVLMIEEVEVVEEEDLEIEVEEEEDLVIEQEEGVVEVVLEIGLVSEIEEEWEEVVGEVDLTMIESPMVIETFRVDIMIEIMNNLSHKTIITTQIKIKIRLIIWVINH